MRIFTYEEIFSQRNGKSRADYMKIPEENFGYFDMVCLTRTF